MRILLLPKAAALLLAFSLSGCSSSSGPSTSSTSTTNPVGDGGTGSSSSSSSSSRGSSASGSSSKPEAGTNHEDGTTPDASVLEAAANHEAGHEGGSTPEAGAHEAGGGDAAPTQVHLSGALAKGPFVQGSSVVVSPTDSLGNPTGTNFQTSTTDNLGDFTLTFTYQGPALLTGTGFYFNEEEGALSGAPITLKSFTDVTSSGAQNAYVNLVTHLAFNREQTLFATESFTAAVTQAETELRGQIAVGGPTFNPGAAGAELNLVGGDNVESAYLFAVGSVFAEAAALSTAAGSEDAKLQQLVDTTASDLATAGTLPAATITALGQAQQCVEPDVYMASLQANFTSNGETTVVPNINRALDSDLDGIPNLSDNCPLVANPAQNVITNGICDYERGSMTASATNVYGGKPAAADVDGVHGTDMVLFGVQEIDAWLNDGTGHFGAPIVTTAAAAGLGGFSAESTQIVGPALGDMNGDGHPDIVVGLNPQGSEPIPIGYLPGDGAGHFGTYTQLFAASYQQFDDDELSQSLVLVDLNGDGRLDIMSGASIAFAPASGAWSGFTTTLTFPKPVGATGDAPSIHAVAVADMNEDGNPDVILAAAGDTTSTYGGVATLFGTGAGTFPTSTTYTSTFGLNAYTVATGDVDGDGHQDLVVEVVTAAAANGVTTVGFGAGNGTMAASTTIATTAANGPEIVGQPCGDSNCFYAGGGAQPLAAVLADFTGDGKQDIVFLATGAIAVSQGRTIAAPIGLNMSFSCGDALPVDLNGDGISDLCTGAFLSPTYVLFNQANYHSW